ncbi:SusC/RagA family TonB-linked outer membrane protein [Bacteroidales bacterium]|nr:SusC/RagA family TonB-linked outer membrane protein [Bacteroidales bacterium]
MTIKAIFAEIEKQTNTSVDYDESIIDVGKKISATKSGTLSTVLDQTLKNTNCLYTIKGKHIVISPKPKGKENLIKTRGTVLDEKGDAVIGASVVVKGTNSGTVSDLDGQFELELDENAVLVISYLGYLPQDFAVEGNTFFSVNLREDTQFLDEVVVVGYGIQKKVNVIGSIAQIGSEKLENRATPMLSNALTGQMSGVTVVQRSGRPGESSGKIRVRGVGSFDDKDEYSSTKSDALVLIDGLPGDLNDINPEDVESISVLKDASTAAIYGSRAANGVILVTTKTGKEGKVSIAYNAYAGFNKATAFPEFVNSWEYATLMNEAQGREVYTAQDIQKYRDGSDLDNYANSKYLDEVFSENGFQTGHDLTLNGGSSSNRYLLSVGYLSQDGLVKKNNYERYNTRLNLVSDLLPNLKITTRLSGIYSMRNEPSVPGGIDADNVMGIAEYAVRFPGLHPTKLSNGTYGRGPKLQGTPRAWIDSDSFFENPNFKVNSNIRLDYTPIKDLQLSALGGYNYENQELKRYRSSFKLGNDITIGPSSLRHEMQKTIYKTFQATAQYGKSIQEHSFAALAGYSWEDQSYRTLVGFRDKFPGNDLPFLNAGSPDNQQSGGNAYEWAIQSLFGRLQYNYKERYLFESTVRYDGSSRFSKGEKYGFFPSLAAGWRMSEEAFIKDKENLNWISNLKIKASWGILGNQNIGNYPYQSVYQLGQNYPFGENYAQGAAITTAVDPSIRWEETQTIDGGLEGVFWNGLISTNISYFYRKTQDILYKPSGSVSSILGLRISEMNTGKLKNEGWEFELGHRNKIGNVSYNMNANFTIINNKLLSLGVGNVDQLNGMVGNGSNLFVGYPIDMYYGYQTDGVFLNQQDIDTWYDQSKINPKPQIGDIRYKDISGPDGVPDGKVDPNYDRVSLGSRIPQYTFGINIGADYKKFDLQLQFQGVSKVKGMLDTYAGWAFWSEGNIQRWQADGRFDPESPERNPAYPRLEDLGNMVGPNTQTSDFWTLDASYLRLKNVQVGYTLPKSVLKNMKIASLRFYMSSENPISWNKYRDGWDPEINTSGNYYPILATYTFGLNLKF